MREKNGELREENEVQKEVQKIVKKAAECIKGDQSNLGQKHNLFPGHRDGV